MVASRDPGGPGRSPPVAAVREDYKAVFNDAGDWVRDEINARKAEIVFLTKVVAALKTLETMVK